MSAWAYYNEIDPHAAQWLRNLMGFGVIAPGYVDERSIADVLPDELADFAQCHFFAGIGVWSAALRGAGWDDHRPVWTGSCPCQPFSTAGRGEGFSDERHLWPAFFHLIAERRPPIVFGEQVASSDADDWIDLVQDDMEGVEYAVGATPFPSSGVGAPHIRDRLWWVAHYDGQRCDQRSTASGLEARAGARIERSSGPRLMADMHGDGRDQARERQPEAGHDGFVGDGSARILGDAGGDGVGEHAGKLRRDEGQHEVGPALGHHAPIVAGAAGHHGRPGPTNGFWRDPDWLLCRDGLWRPVEPGTFPLVDGSAFRVGSGSAFEGKSRAGMLKGYGNAINKEAAQAFIRAVMEVCP